MKLKTLRERERKGGKKSSQFPRIPALEMQTYAIVNSTIRSTKIKSRWDRLKNPIACRFISSTKKKIKQHDRKQTRTAKQRYIYLLMSAAAKKIHWYVKSLLSWIHSFNRIKFAPCAASWNISKNQLENRLQHLQFFFSLIYVMACTRFRSTHT